MSYAPQIQSTIMYPNSFKFLAGQSVLIAVAAAIAMFLHGLPIPGMLITLPVALFVYCAFQVALFVARLDRRSRRFGYFLTIALLSSAVVFDGLFLSASLLGSIGFLLLVLFPFIYYAIRH